MEQLTLGVEATLLAPSLPRPVIPSGEKLKQSTKTPVNAAMLQARCGLPQGTILVAQGVLSRPVLPWATLAGFPEPVSLVSLCGSRPRWEEY